MHSLEDHGLGRTSRHTVGSLSHCWKSTVWAGIPDNKSRELFIKGIKVRLAYHQHMQNLHVKTRGIQCGVLQG